MATTERPGLALGPQVRSRRAMLKRAMRVDVDLALRVVAGQDDRWGETASDMAVETLLLAVPGVGPALVDEVLDGRRIPPTTRLYGLTDERRVEISKALKEAITR